MASLQKLLGLFLLIHISYSVSTKTIPVKDPNNILFTFGSCNKYYGDEPDDIFYKVADLKPDVWAWLGDVAYVDEKIMPPIFGYAGEEKIKEKLHNAKTSPPYVALRKATNVIGVWDDHDYGLNNAGRSFQHKNLTQQLWLDFIDEPSDSPRRQRKGVYESYYIGDSSKVKVILLDVRYFREDNSIFKGKKNTDALGDEQWAWLENELKENKAQYVVIGSGVQILPDDRVFPENFYDESRDKLIGLIKKYKVNGVILISGDVHFAEILKHPCPQKIGFELYEITSSGLTHHVSTHVPFADQYVKTVLPDTWSTADDRYCDLNFGVIHFTFGKDGKAKCEIKDVNGKTVLHQDIAFSQLQFSDKSGDEKAMDCIADRHRHVRFVENYAKAIVTGKWYPIAVLVLIIFVVMGIVSLFKFIFRLPGRIYRLFSPAPPKKVKHA